MSSEYDVYLNGVGYHLLKRADGQLQSGAAQERKTNPFARQLSADEQYVRVPFRFGDGGGLAEHDGSYRYESADYIDTRSGRVILGAKTLYTVGASTQYPTEQYPACDNLIDNSGSQIGIAQQFQVPAGKSAIRAVQLLVRRDPDTDYSDASDFTVAIYDNTTGPKPNTSLGSATVSLKGDAGAFLPWPDRWRGGQYFWLEVVFSADIGVTPTSYYWVVVTNNDSENLYWGDVETGTTATRSTYNGSVWTNGDSNYPLCLGLGYVEDVDSWPRSFCEFAGTDKVKRLYVGLANKVMYWSSLTAETLYFTNSKVLSAPVLQLLEFNSRMYAAQGPDQDMWYTDGSVPGSAAWTQVTNVKAQALAIHDNMLWKAGGAELKASKTGDTSDWGAQAGKIGDPGTPIQSMVSHGGKLFCAKPEGIFEVTYPAAYPGGTDPPVGNMMLDFRTELAPRTWILDWHSGLYFGGFGGVYELKSGILRNLWTEKIDEGAQEVPQETGYEVRTSRLPYTRPRRWGPIYDASPGCFTYAIGTSRGIYLCYSDANLQVTHLWFYDGRNWHDLGPVDTQLAVSDYRTLGQYALTAHLMDVGGGRGYLFCGLGGNIKAWRWPTWTNDRTQDSWANYVSDPTNLSAGLIYTPVFSVERQSTNLQFCKVGVTGRIGQTNNTIQVYYKIDQATSWTSLGTITSGSSKYTELDFPAGTTGREIQFKLSLKMAATNTISPVVDQLELLYQPIPDSYTTHQLMIHAAPDLALHDGAVDTRTTGEILTALRGLVGNSGFTYLDPAGTSHTVRVTGMSIQHMRQTKEPGATLPTEAVAIVTLLDV